MATVNEVHDTDVLVIGGGLAGCLAALKARETTERVVLVDKARVSRSGASSFGTGGVLFPTPQDDLELWAETSFFRHERGLKKMLEQVYRWKENLSHIIAKDTHELAKAHEIRSLLDCLELLFSTALLRKESRGLQTRLDYPYRDDINWLKWVIAGKDEGGMRIRTQPVPLYRYPIKPKKYEVIPLAVPLPRVESTTT